MIPQGGGSIILVASMSANVCLPITLGSARVRRSELLPLDRQRTPGKLLT
jgi:hypothetical protein